MIKLRPIDILFEIILISIEKNSESFNINEI